MSGDSAHCEKTSQLIKVGKEKASIVEAKSSTSKLMNELFEECRKLDIQTANAISRMRLTVKQQKEQFYDLESSLEESDPYESASEDLVSKISEQKC